MSVKFKVDTCSLLRYVLGWRAGRWCYFKLIVNFILNFVFKVTLMTHVLCSEVNELGELGDGVTINVIVKSTFSFFCKVT